MTHEEALLELGAWRLVGSLLAGIDTPCFCYLEMQLKLEDLANKNKELEKENSLFEKVSYTISQEKIEDLTNKNKDLEEEISRLEGYVKELEEEISRL